MGREAVGTLGEDERGVNADGTPGQGPGSPGNLAGDPRETLLGRGFAAAGSRPAGQGVQPLEEGGGQAAIDVRGEVPIRDEVGRIRGGGEGVAAQIGDSGALETGGEGGL